MTIKQYFPKEGETSLKCYIAIQGEKAAFGHSHANAIRNLCLQLVTLKDYENK